MTTTDEQTQPTAAIANTAQAEGQGSGAGPVLFDASIIEACEEVVEKYRQGSVPRTDAAFDLGFLLCPVRGMDPEVAKQRKAGFSNFYAQLNDIDKDRELAQQRGERHTEELPPIANLSLEETPMDTAEQPGTVEGSGLRVKRGREQDDEETVHKQPLDESLLPTALQLGPGGDIDPGLLIRSEVAETLALKANYLRDTSTVKQRVLCSPECTDIPEALWSDVICDKFVDFDKLYSAVYAIDGDRRETYRIGELELATTSTKASRSVTSHGDWTIAWSKYEEAVTLLYPHRMHELRRYAEHINRLFSVIQSEPGRVIAYDRAVRGVVGRTNMRLLTDFNEWNYLHTLHIVTPGAGTSRNSRQAQGGGGFGPASTKSKEACKRWNEGRCSRQNCRYRHICSTCNSRGHSANSCTRSRGEHDGHE